MPVTVVPTSLATVAIDTFITELSSVMRNWPAASVSSTMPAAPAACPRVEPPHHDDIQRPTVVRVTNGGRTSRVRAEDLGLLGRELGIGEDALVAQLAELGELREHVVRVRRRRWWRGRRLGVLRLRVLRLLVLLLPYADWSFWAQRLAWRRETRLLTAVAVPATTAVRAMPRRSPGMSVPFVQDSTGVERGHEGLRGDVALATSWPPASRAARANGSDHRFS